MRVRFLLGVWKIKVAYIDAGNTRLKYRIQQDGSDDVDAGVIDYSDLIAVERLFGGVVRVYASVVGGAEQKSQIEALLDSVVDEVLYISSDDMGELFYTDYLQPNLLGIDRWLAMYAIVNSGCHVVVDAGTALTVDVISGRKHLGGYIVPGYFLQLHSLSESAGLPHFGGVNRGVELGVDTATCIERGVWALMSSFIESVVTRYPEAELHMTGGDADALAQLIQYPCKIHGNLVLDGLMKFRSRVVC